MNLKKDVLPIFKKYQISLKEKVREVGDIHTFIFEMDEPIRWVAGQHGLFRIQHTKVKKNFRIFSIASISPEGIIKISTKIGENPSEFKQALLDLEPGMKISMRGPVGSFYVKEQKPLLFIAGGIGITPYGAIVKDLRVNSEDFSKEMRLLYLDSKKYFIYHKELEEAEKVPGIKTDYLTTRENLYKEIDNFIEKHHNEAEYFVSGPKPMTKAMEKALKDKGIKGKKIRKDGFIGY